MQDGSQLTQGTPHLAGSAQLCPAAAPRASPVPQSVVPDLLHQLEDAGQRRAEHIHGQEVLLPRGHGGFHKDLLDVGHGSTHVLGRAESVRLQQKQGRDGSATLRGGTRQDSAARAKGV